MQQWLGILLGLGSALGASLAYLCSRRYAVRAAAVETHQPAWRPPLRLLVTAHVWLGLACAVALPTLVVTTGLELARPIHAAAMSAGVAGFYLVGNVFLFASLRRTDASRIAPLLGLKVVILALCVELFAGEDFSAAQWLAVVLASGAAVMLGTSGSRLPVKTFALVLGTCMGFVLSDLFIKQMIPAWLPAGLALEDADTQERITAAMTGMALAYVWCGGVAVAMLPVVLRGVGVEQIDAVAGSAPPPSEGGGRGEGRQSDPHQHDTQAAATDPPPSPLPGREAEPEAVAQRVELVGFFRALVRSLPGGLPYAGAWFFSMVCLFSCFSLVGIVFGGILQSTRGLISIALGMGIAWLGHHHLESHAPWPVVVKRLIAAAAMTAAIALYTMG